MQNLDKEYLIRKWLANDLSLAERKDFEQLEDFEFYKKIVDNAKYFDALEIEQPANLNTFYLRKLEQEQNVENNKSTLFSKVINIAAAVLLLFGIVFFWLSNEETTFKTLASNKINVSLPDSSLVTLNSKSEIAFNKTKWANKREVKLDGEAFFEVKKGSKFDVISSAGRVRVVGTKFNVKNRESYFEVKCYEGVVSVNTGNKINTLKAGQSCRLMNDSIYMLKFKNQSPTWLNNKSYFKSVPFSEVIKEFERQYNMDVTLQYIDPNQLFTGGFTHDNLVNALNSITFSLDLLYNIESGDQVILRK